MNEKQNILILYCACLRC